MAKIYCTGDLACWLEDGNIQYFGRMDSQVKIRGFRIELGEIESRLLEVFGVVEAVVVSIEKREKDGKAGGVQLAAYVVYSGKEEQDVSMLLRDALGKVLPDYMVPAYFVLIERIPRTSGGKIDRTSLPVPGVSDEERETIYEAPVDQAEQVLAQVWEDVLGISSIGRDDNFFKLGGDSIKVIQVSSRLMRHRVKIENSDIFTHPTIRQLVSCMKQMTQVISQEVVEGDVGLTPVQKWFFENKKTQVHHFNHFNHFNHYVMLAREVGFDERIVREVFDKLIRHHDALRMVFRFGEIKFDKSDQSDQSNQSGELEIHQYNRGCEGTLFDFFVYDFSEEEGGASLDYLVLIEEKSFEVQSGIDLENGPLVRLALFKLPEAHHLLIVVHHLVIDGVSWRIVLDDFQAGYLQVEKGQDIRFQDKTHSFLYWSRRLSRYAQEWGRNETLDHQRYWEKRLNVPVDSFPVDFQIPVEKKIMGNTRAFGFALDEERTRMLLTEVHDAYNTQVEDILLAALALAFYRWKGLTAVLVNMEGHGREGFMDNIDINRTVGWFTSIYPVILEYDAQRDISYAVKSTKEMLRQVPGKGVSYGILKYLVSPGSRSEFEAFPVPSVYFNYFGQVGFEKAQSDTPSFMRFSEYKAASGTGPGMERAHVLDIGGKVIDRQLVMEIVYNPYQYSEPAVPALGESYKSMLEEVIRHCTHSTLQELTPSDFEYSDIDLDMLDEIKGKLEFLE